MQYVQLIWKKSCDTCRRFKKQLDLWGVEYIDREMNAEPLTAEEIAELIGDRPVKPFLNTRNKVYRDMRLKNNTPDATTAALLIAQENNLLKRPVVQIDDELVLGNDLATVKRLLNIEA
jgi:arsenate reductase-like glutaredoxin family protein